MIQLIPSIRIIIEPMYTIVRMYIAWVWLLSSIGILYKLYASVFMYCKNNFERVKLEQQTKLKYKQRKTELIKQFNMLSVSEKEIIHAAMQKSSIWLPEVNAEAQLLLYKGFIKNISSVGKFEDWNNSGEREWCILVIVPDEIRSILLSIYSDG